MKTKISVFASILALILLLSACGDRPEPLSPSEPAPPSEPDYIALYSPILESVHDLITAQDDEYTIGDGQTGIFEATIGVTAEDALEDIGYTVHDLSGDGVPELVIGFVNEPNLLAVYTLSEGETVLSFEGWARNRYYLLTDGSFWNEGSNGAAYSIAGIYDLAENGTGLVARDFWFTYETDETFEEYAVYHNSTGIYDKSVSERSEMSLDEFFGMMDSIRSQFVQLELTPFSQYAQQ